MFVEARWMHWQGALGTFKKMPLARMRGASSCLNDVARSLRINAPEAGELRNPFDGADQGRRPEMDTVCPRCTVNGGI